MVLLLNVFLIASSLFARMCSDNQEPLSNPIPIPSAYIYTIPDCGKDGKPGYGCDYVIQFVNQTEAEYRMIDAIAIGNYTLEGDQIDVFVDEEKMLSFKILNKDTLQNLKDNNLWIRKK
jgi:hypothetical protein